VNGATPAAGARAGQAPDGRTPEGDGRDRPATGKAPDQPATGEPRDRRATGEARDRSAAAAAGPAVREVVAAVTRELAGAGCVSAQAEAHWLVEEALGLDRPGLAGRDRQPVPGPARARLAAMVARRVAGEPLQYVVGWAPFGSLRLEVGPGVFVPRPETEGLAERAARRLRAWPVPRLAVDLCTGSGALACFLADAVPGARVVATELDPGALAWARRNTGRHGVELLAGDLDRSLPPELAGRVQVMTANVPYVPTAAIDLLPRDVREHEPRLALDGGRDGLDVLREVAARAPRWLAPGGALLCEIGDDQGETAARVLQEAGFGEVGVHPDLAGRDRVIEGIRPVTDQDQPANDQDQPANDQAQPAGTGEEGRVTTDGGRAAAGGNGDPGAGPPHPGGTEGADPLADEPRVVRVTADEELWDGLLEVGGQVIARGGLVVVPTDTVYGVGCDPFNASAVDALFRAKGRGRDLPLPVLVHGWRQAIGLVEEVTDQAKALIAAWWPGPLSIVLREAAGIGWDLGYSRGTVMVRMPKQTFTLALIQRTGPLAVSSANRSGLPTPGAMPGIVEQLGDEVGAFFDAGPAGGGPASTIVDLTGPFPRLLRRGAIPEEEIQRVLDEPLVDATRAG
jgi:release factor glutamine methyltransferase